MTVSAEKSAAEIFDEAVAIHAGGDTLAAIKMMEPIAAGGLKQARVWLINVYRNGDGIPPSLGAGFFWSFLGRCDDVCSYQTLLGNMYYHGDGITQSYEAAKDCYEIAAEHGGGNATIRLSDMYRNGIGVEQDHSTAFKWCRAAALMNQRGAAYLMGWHYVNGLGAKQDYQAGHKWLLSAARDGSQEATLLLAVLEAKGLGVPEHSIGAMKWAHIGLTWATREYDDLNSPDLRQNAVTVELKEAALSVKQRAEAIVAELTSRMTAAEIQVAEHLAEEFLGGTQDDCHLASAAS